MYKRLEVGRWEIIAVSSRSYLQRCWFRVQFCREDVLFIFFCVINYLRIWKFKIVVIIYFVYKLGRVFCREIVFILYNISCNSQIAVGRFVFNTCYSCGWSWFFGSSVEVVGFEFFFRVSLFYVVWVYVVEWLGLKNEYFKREEVEIDNVLKFGFRNWQC